MTHRPLGTTGRLLSIQEAVMTVLESIKYKIKMLYSNQTKIHIPVSINRPKVVVPTQEATIIGIYPNIFRIETQEGQYTLLYTDILTNNIMIAELQK